MKRERVVVAVLAMLGVIVVGGFLAYSSRPHPQATHPGEGTPQLDSVSLNEVCRDQDQEDDMVSSQVCTYGTTSTEAVYQHLWRTKVAPEVASLLERRLPRRSMSAAPGQNDAGVVAIDYQIEGPGLPRIEIQFEGGVDSYRIADERGQVSLEISQSAD